VETTDLTQI